MRPTLKRRIAHYLKAHGKSQRDWALDLGITPAYLSQIMAGDRTPALALACRMARDMDVPVETFIANGRTEVAS